MLDGSCLGTSEHTWAQLVPHSPLRQIQFYASSLKCSAHSFLLNSNSSELSYILYENSPT